MQSSTWGGGGGSGRWEQLGLAGLARSNCLPRCCCVETLGPSNLGCPGPVCITLFDMHCLTRRFTFGPTGKPQSVSQSLTHSRTL